MIKLLENLLSTIYGIEFCLRLLAQQYSASVSVPLVSLSLSHTHRFVSNLIRWTNAHIFWLNRIRKFRHRWATNNGNNACLLLSIPLSLARYSFHLGHLALVNTHRAVVVIFIAYNSKKKSRCSIKINQYDRNRLGALPRCFRWIKMTNFFFSSVSSELLKVLKDANNTVKISWVNGSTVLRSISDWILLKCSRNCNKTLEWAFRLAIICQFLTSTTNTDHNEYIMKIR